MLLDQLLVTVFRNHEEMRAWVFDEAGNLKSSDLGTVGFDLLCKCQIKDGQALVRVDRDEDWGANLGVDFA